MAELGGVLDAGGTLNDHRGAVHPLRGDAPSHRDLLSHLGVYRVDPGAVEGTIMKAFGIGSLSYEHGYDLPIVLSHLEGLLDGEVDLIHEQGGGKKKMQRIALVEQAIEKLSEAMDMGGEGC